MMRKRIDFLVKAGSAGLLAVAVLVGLAFWHASSVQNDAHRRLRRTPRLVLWAWEEPEDLRFLDTGHVGVAFLASTVNLNGEKASIRPRFQRLLVPDDAKLIAVVRIEAGQDATPPREILKQSKKCAPSRGGCEEHHGQVEAQRTDRSVERKSQAKQSPRRVNE